MSLFETELGPAGEGELQAALGPRSDSLPYELEGMRYELETTGPVFRLVCPGGCPMGTEAQCRRVLRTAMRDAIVLANRAASRLEAQPRSTATIRLFQGVFGHSPNRAVPWGGGNDSGAIVAIRYRASARSLRGRGTRYVCGPNLGAENARVLSPGRVLIRPPFWQQAPGLPAASIRNRQLRAGTILHEMMHQYFSFIRHNAQERRRNNARCFEVFALRASGIVPLPIDVTRCASRPA